MARLYNLYLQPVPFNAQFVAAGVDQTKCRTELDLFRDVVFLHLRYVCLCLLGPYTRHARPARSRRQSLPDRSGLLLSCARRTLLSVTAQGRLYRCAPH